MVNYNSNSGSFKKGLTPWNKGLKKELDLNFITEKYKRGFSCQEIGDDLEVSEKTIRMRLNDLGIKRRKSNEPNERTRNKISNTLKKMGIQPRKIYKGKPWNKGLKGVQEPWNKGRDDLPESHKKGKTYEEMYGKERSEIYKEQIRERRKTQIFPKKDTLIEVRMAEALQSLKIKFEQHKYISDIEHSYQCDFFIPVQKGIKQRTILECDGDYWHHFPEGREKDRVKTKEMEAAGYRVFRFWEHDIWTMSNQDLKDILYY